MGTQGHYLQVVDAIVLSISVLVMNLLSGEKSPSHVLFSHVAMLKKFPVIPCVGVLWHVQHHIPQGCQTPL